jgi:hypothetical protein
MSSHQQKRLLSEPYIIKEVLTLDRSDSKSRASVTVVTSFDSFDSNPPFDLAYSHTPLSGGTPLGAIFPLNPTRPIPTNLWFARARARRRHKPT